MDQKRSTIFLDRDGTLIEDRHYLSDPSQVVLLDGCAEGLQALVSAGFALVMVTNQSGISRGLVTLEQMKAVNDELAEVLECSGVKLDGVFYCPHHPDDLCDCRKPRVGMFEQAAAHLRIDISGSWVIGDKCSDVQFGANIGARTVLLSADALNSDSLPGGCEPTATVKSFREAVAFVISGRS